MEDKGNSTIVKLIGLYTVEENAAVTLVELLIHKRAGEFDIGQFTQEVENRPRDSWQAPFAEKYLDADGEKIIGDDFDLPTLLSDITRLTFYIYFLDISKPLLTPFGQLSLQERTNQPQRIKDIVFFTDPE